MATAGETANRATMRAAFFGEPGPAEAIEVGDLPVPVPGPTDALVAVEVAVINPVDTLIRSGRWPTLTPLPFVTGRDLVGTVTAAGAGSGFSPGDRVWSNSLGYAGRQGTCAEYAVVPGDRLYPLPDGAVATEAAAAFHSAETAFIGLHHRAGARAGQTILVGGAAGGIGSALLRFASEAGLCVIATARPGDHARCLEQGANAVFDFGGPDLADAAHAINRHLAGGGFAMKAAEIMPLGRAAEAHALVGSRQSARVVIQIGRQP